MAVAGVWAHCNVVTMEKMQADMGELMKQGAETADAIKSLTESLKGLRAWVPQIDDTVRTLQKLIDAVGARVSALESPTSLPLLNTSRPGWHAMNIKIRVI
ncbi:hypothetical protein QYE76_050225 [Lolium multiflorum]|uniref:Uncharacterized protein n=1 Tax=Lolium multiflorum TaxID=4521 RepID=A0AAD8WHM1_LOLMU|nr:hypothetical protein QYE76_050225 [Lolium multiflorum]